jgi:hypothetical protein
VNGKLCGTNLCGAALISPIRNSGHLFALPENGMSGTAHNGAARAG